MKGDSYAEKSAHIRRLAAMPPEKLMDGLSEAHPNIAEVAPNIAPHVHSTAIRAIQYLNSKLPPSGLEMPLDSEPVASRSQKDQWMKAHEAVSDPVSVLDHVKNGTVSPHHVNALRAVYPDLHQEMSSKMAEEIGALKAEGKSLPYSTKLSVARFMGSPIDSTMTPQNMQAVIVSSAPQQAAQAQSKAKQQKASGGELSQINKVTSMYGLGPEGSALGKKA